VEAVATGEGALVVESVVALAAATTGLVKVATEVAEAMAAWAPADAAVA